MFASDVVEGRISDRALVEKSIFLDEIESGDVILADRGFNIHDLVLEKGATLIIPPFLGKRKQFSREEIINTKIIARSRIHIERFNERLKNFRIVSGIIPSHIRPYLSQLVFVLCNFVNFEEPLCQNKK